MKPLIVYHAACPDGWTSAWACTKALGDCELFAGYYGAPPPDVLARDVYIVDFSYPREVLLAMAETARRILVLDHHATAEKHLAGLEHPAIVCTFDKQRSGAGLAWDILVDGPRPWLIDYVEDRDLWRFKLPHSIEVSAFVMSTPYTLEAWDELAATPLPQAAAAGTFIRRKIGAYCRAMSLNVRRCDVPALLRQDAPPGGPVRISVEQEALRDVPIVNAPQVDVSDLLHHLCVELAAPVAIAWHQRGDGLYVFSLRSEGAVDVSLVAERFGGGGHPAAAGFQAEELPAWARGRVA